MPLVPMPPKEPKPKRPRGHQRGVKLADKHKSQIKATKLMDRLADAAEGRVDMTTGQVRAAEVYLSKTIPSLSAVEQTNLNDDVKTPEQLQATLEAMLENPVIRNMLMKMLEKPSIQLVKNEG